MLHHTDRRGRRSSGTLMFLAALVSISVCFNQEYQKTDTCDQHALRSVQCKRQNEPKLGVVPVRQRRLRRLHHCRDRTQTSFDENLDQELLSVHRGGCKCAIMPSPGRDNFSSKSFSLKLEGFSISHLSITRLRRIALL